MVTQRVHAGFIILRALGCSVQAQRGHYYGLRDYKESRIHWMRGITVFRALPQLLGSESSIAVELRVAIG